jgi:hypothetical protein
LKIIMKKLSPRNESAEINSSKVLYSATHSSMCFHGIPYITLCVGGHTQRLYSFKHFLIRNFNLTEELASELLQKWIDTVPEKLCITYPDRYAPSKPKLTRNTLVGTKDDIIITMQNLQTVHPPMASFLRSKGIPIESEMYKKRKKLFLKMCEVCGTNQCVYFSTFDGKWKVPEMYCSFEDEEYGGYYVCNDCVLNP